MPAQLGGGVGGLLAEKKTAGHREPGISDRVGVAQEAGKALPSRQLELALRAVNDGFSECDRKTDAGVYDLVVIGVVVDEPAKVVNVEAEMTDQALAGAEFEVIAMGRLNGRRRTVGSKDCTREEPESRRFSNDGV